MNCCCRTMIALGTDGSGHDDESRVVVGRVMKGVGMKRFSVKEWWVKGEDSVFDFVGKLDGSDFWRENLDLAGNRCNPPCRPPSSFSL